MLTLKNAIALISLENITWLLVCLLHENAFVVKDTKEVYLKLDLA